jgi:hypothetical protein
MVRAISKETKVEKRDYITGHEYIVDRSFRDDGEWNTNIEK